MIDNKTKKDKIKKGGKGKREDEIRKTEGQIQGETKKIVREQEE